VPELLGPVVHVPRSPLALALFGLPALLPAAVLARSRFQGERARALFAGNAVHSVMPLDALLSSAVALVLGAAGHAGGWPVVAGGAGRLTQALAAYLRSLGGDIVTGHAVASLDALPPCDAVLFDTSAGALERIAGDRLSPAFRRTLAGFKQGPGAFKVDWALSQPIPWRAASCRQAATVHVGGSLAEIAAAEVETFANRHSDRPFVLLVQPGVCDPLRAPAGQATAWAYCHVPNGSTVDRTSAIEAQVERFAPGFRDCILARRTWSTAQLEAWNPNLAGGDLSGGAMTVKQLLLRPSVREYGTSDPAIFLCSAATPPGGGVHGMCGYHAARLALSRVGRARHAAFQRTR
jgi:phytoene dehydrogenase-like protein